MSANGWNAYITNLKSQSKSITRAAIVAAADGSVWARSEDPDPFTASADELSAFAKLFDHIEDVPAKGFDLEGVHYIVPRTKLAVVIACYEGETHDGQDCREAVENVSKYLTTQGY